VDLLVQYSVLLVVTPGLMDLRGNVYGAMGYRLTKALHLGLTQPRFRTRYNLVNIANAYVVSTVASIILCVVGYTLSLLSRLGSPDPLSLLFLALSSTIIVFIVLTPITTMAIIHLFNRGRDPSSFVAAIVTGIGDFATPFVLITTAYLHGAFPWVVKLLVVALLTSTCIILAIYVSRSGGLKDLVENLYSSIIASTGSSMGGFILASRASFISENPEILGVIPAFNAVIGASMGYLGSVLNIDIHIGYKKPYSAFRGRVFIGFIATYASILTASLISLLASPIEPIGVALFLLVVSLSTIIVYTSSTAITYYLTIYSYRHGWDPDNIVFPIMTTVVDIIGPATISLIGALIA
jgi:mgtE-like transporter